MKSLELVILAVIFLSYPVLCFLAFICIKLLEFIYLHVFKATSISKCLFLGLLLFVTYPIHVFDTTSFIQIDETLPFYMVFMESHTREHFSFLYPESLTTSGFSWHMAIPGIFFKSLWIIFSIKKVHSLYYQISNR